MDKLKNINNLALAASPGFAYNTNFYFSTKKKQIHMKRVTAIGGIFFKCKDPEKVKEWYKTHLGLDITPYGAKVQWQQEDTTQDIYTLWTPFADNTKFFDPSPKDFMINYRVENIEALVAALKEEGVTVLDNIETYDEYGKFVHILDIEGNKIELWEPKR